jgi:hypothetical protein
VEGCFVRKNQTSPARYDDERRCIESFLRTGSAWQDGFVTDDSCLSFQVSLCAPDGVAQTRLVNSIPVPMNAEGIMDQVTAVGRLL